MEYLENGERWRSVDDFPDYDVSDMGRVRHYHLRHVLTQAANDAGYMTVGLMRCGRQHNVRVHKLVAETFFGKHPGMIVRHIDEDRSNNHLSNLYWSTQREAIKDAYDRGSKIPYQSKPVRVVETGEVFCSMKECADAIGCHRTQIYQCLIGKCKHAKGYHIEWV